MTTAYDIHCKRGIYFIGVVALVMLASIPLAWGVADFQAAGARNQLAQWEKNYAVGDDEAWNRALERLMYANELHPENSSYEADLGRIYEWRAQKFPVWHKEAKIARTRSIHHFRKATDLRPAWGYIWAHYTQGKILNQEFDADALASFEKSMVLAPWESDAQQKILYVGMNIWDLLPIDMQSMLRTTLSRALANNPTATIKLTAAMGKQKIVEPLLSMEQRVLLARYSQRFGKRS